MSEYRSNISASPTTQTQVARNRVLRNTYWLLTLSMIPTIIGAFLGLSLNIGAAMSTSPGMSLIVFFAGAFGLMFLVEKNKNSSLGVVLDRKSTRLNSSHVAISYAVFCLKK